MGSLHDRSRSDWEQQGFTVAEHTTSGPVRRGLLTSVVLHYPGSNNDVSSDTAQRLRNTQRYYAQARGYSIGYNYVVDPAGVLWEARGLDFANAANKGANLNTVSVQILVKGQDGATDAQVARVRKFVDDVRVWAGEKLQIVPHRSVSATQCPGEGIMSQLNSGMFEPVEVDQPVKEFEMKIVSPVRMYDSRSAEGPFRKRETRRVHIGDVDAAFVNVTVVPYGKAGHVTVWGSGDRPNVSNVNYLDRDVCNTSWVPVVDGHIYVYSWEKVDVIIDLQATS